MAVVEGEKVNRADRLKSADGALAGLPANYKWIALFISTLGM